VVLAFRERLLDADTLERVLQLFKGTVDTPPLFIEQIAHVILRNILDGCDDPLKLARRSCLSRAARRPIQGAMRCSPIARRCRGTPRAAATARFGRLIVEAQGTLGKVDLERAGQANAQLYWEANRAMNTVISLAYGRAGSTPWQPCDRAVGAAFLASPCASSDSRIDDRTGPWPSASTPIDAILNDLWSGAEVEHGRMQRILALVALEFEDARAYAPILPAARCTRALGERRRRLRMKPQNCCQPAAQ